MIRKLIHHAAIFSPIDEGSPLAGTRQGSICHIAKGAMAIVNGRIAWIGPLAELPPEFAEPDETIDAAGACLVPGFVDPHTHLCFAVTREAEFAERLQGAAYLDILKRGGGILSSVRAVQEASQAELVSATRRRALTALSLGTTTMEIKSGYGLDTVNELKMLRAIREVGRTTPLDVVPTFLGAHAIPPTFSTDPDAFIQLLIDEMLPAVQGEGLADFCDIFCEKGVFSIDQGRRLLKAAKALGMKVKIHADEVNDLGGASLAAELAAVSADHLLAASETGIARMAAAGTLATLLPATAYSLRKPFARARMMLDQGAALALATDCNPGSSFTESMPFVIGLAVLMMGLSPAEALTAATLNAAYAIGMADRVGSLTVGKQADCVLLAGESPAILAYHAGVSPVMAVYKRGEKVA